MIWRRKRRSSPPSASDAELVDAAAIPLVKAALEERGARGRELLEWTIAAHKLVKAGATIADAVEAVLDRPLGEGRIDLR